MILCKYLNDQIEQDHRRIKRRVRSMRGFESEATAPIIVAGTGPAANAPCSRRNGTQPALTSNRPQFPETRLSPITPAKMRTMQSTLSGAAESPNSVIPRIAVPAAPIPVQTA
jgi:hypothetical protein